MGTRRLGGWEEFEGTDLIVDRQYLEEDPRTNRIDDSLQLWTALCQNKLLSKAALILMLNKVLQIPELFSAVGD